MKRISLLAIAVLVGLPGIAKAYYYAPMLYRTRYSPYAFSYKHTSGLIPGGLRYSPYASGLVPYSVRYSPYAFSRGHSGLISDCGGYGFGYGAYTIVCGVCRTPAVVDCEAHQFCQAASHGCCGSAGDMYSDREAQLRANKERTRRLQESRKEMKALRENDGKEIIYNYLKSKNVDFSMNKLLKIENKTLSVEFLLKDKNMIIKYWNPDEMQQVGQQPGYRKNICEQYQEAWRDLSQRFAANGGKIYEIESANKEEILSRLDLCSQLNDG
jgi:hypothetical protein